MYGFAIFQNDDSKPFLLGVDVNPPAYAPICLILLVFWVLDRLFYPFIQDANAVWSGSIVFEIGGSFHRMRLGA